MSNAPRVTIRDVAWLELFPWLRILRCFGLSLQFRMLLFAGIGLILMEGGWAAIHFAFRAFDTPESQSAAYDTQPFQWDRLATPPREPNAAPMWPPADPNATSPDGMPGVPLEFGARHHFWMPRIIERIISPVLEYFDPNYPVEFRWSRFVRQTARAIWALLIWSFLGAAIARAAALDLTIRERIGIGQMFAFSASKWRSCVGAVLIPLVAVFILGTGLGLVGTLGAWHGTLFVVHLLWPALFLVGFLMALLAVGLFIGWPLIFAAVATEDSDSYDGVSRAFTYVYQRPLNCLLYGLFAFLVIGGLGYLLVDWFVELSARLTDWGLAWGSGRPATSSPTHVALAQWIPQVFIVSYLWVGATAIYLLLRYDVDRAEHDMVGGLERLAPEAEGINPIAPAPATDQGDDPNATHDATS